jgi:hypothetical protein
MPAANPAFLTAGLLEDLVDCSLNVAPIWAKEPGKVPGPWARQVGARDDELTMVLVSKQGSAGLPRTPFEGIANDELASISCEPSDLTHG